MNDIASQQENEAGKRVCFVIMPIADIAGYEPGHFGRVYEHLIKPAVIAAGFEPVRADDTNKTDYIVIGIIKRLVESPMVLCDYSARNPNVMYELGVRHAFNLPVVLIKDRKTDKVFDIQGLRYADYDESLRVDSVQKDISKIKKSIEETLSANDEDLNSIVKLAGLTAAKVPVQKQVSSDTQLIMSAIASLERRMDKEKVDSKDLLGGDKRIVFYDGSDAGLGDIVTWKGRDYTLVGISSGADSIALADGKKPAFFIKMNSPTAREITAIPF